MEVTTDPTALAGTSADTVYQLQNVGSTTINFVRGSAKPDAGATSGKLLPNAYVRFELDSGESFWLWTLTGQSVVFFDEAL